MKKRKIKKNPNKDILIKYSFSLLDLILFLLLVFAILYNQFVTLDKLSNVVNPIAPFGTFGQFLHFLAQYGNRIFSAWDRNFFIIIIIISLYFLYKEIKYSIFSRYVSTHRFSNKKIIIFLFFVSIISLRYYFAFGNEMHWGDASYFLAMIKSYYENFKNFNFFPYFSYMSSAGNPFYIEYPPLFAYIGALFNLIFHNIHTSAKITLFLFHFLSVVGTYLFVLELGKSKRTAFISALSAMLLYFHGHIFIYLGRYSSAPAWALFPFILLFIEKSFKTLNIKFFALFSLSVGFLFLTNIGMAYIFLMPISIYIITKIIFLFKEKDKYTFKKIFLLICFFFLGVIIGGSYLYFVSISLPKFLFSGITFTTNDTVKTIKNIWQAILIWNNYKIRFFNFSWQISYWGISIIVFSLLGGIYLFSKRKHFPLIFILIFELFIVLSFSWFPIFKYIPYFYKYSIVRYFYVLCTIIIIITGFSYNFLLSKFKNKNKLFITLIFILFIDLFPTTFQDTFGKQYGGNAIPIFNYLKKNFGIKKNLAHFRIDLIGHGLDPYVNQNWRNINAGIAEISVPLLYDDSRVFNLFGIFGNNFYQKKMNLLMNERKYIESENFFKYYYLGNTRFIISAYPLNGNNPFYKKIYKNKNIFFAELKYYSPVLFSTSIEHLKFTSITNMDSYVLLNKYEINYSNNISQKLFITNSFKTNLHIENFTCKLKKHIVNDDSVFLTIVTSSPIYCRLSYTAYPDTKILLNNKNIHYYTSPEGMIVILLNKGINNIKILPKPNKSIKILFVLFLIAFFINILILMVTKRKL